MSLTFFAISVGVTKLRVGYMFLFTSLAAGIRPLLFPVASLRTVSLTHSFFPRLILVILSSSLCSDLLSQFLYRIAGSSDSSAPSALLYSPHRKVQTRPEGLNAPPYSANHLRQEPFFSWVSLSCFQGRSQVSAYVFAGSHHLAVPIPNRWFPQNFSYLCVISILTFCYLHLTPESLPSFL